MGSLTVTGLGKAYKRYARKSGRFAEWLGLGPRHELRWVLRDIDLDIAPGESVAIIGANGAGKSTLLKIITGTTRATAGSVRSQGRIAALLELGIGFHPEFTGRQNIQMSGRLAGMSGEEIERHMAGIETFAGIGDYIDQPVRTYSSGMQVRLAFSVATAVRPDILIVDEALAVGDVFFQQKCFERIRRFREAGTTLLFVSHAMSTVYSLCERAVLIDEGRILLDGPAREAIDLYNALAARRASESPETRIAMEGGAAGEDAETRPDAGPDATPERAATGSYACERVSIRSVSLHAGGEPAHTVIGDSEASVRVDVEFHAAIADPHVGFQIRNKRGEAVFMTHTHGMGRAIGPVEAGQRLQVDFSFRLTLAPGDYTVTAGVAEAGLVGGGVQNSLARVHDAFAFSVGRNPYGIAWDGLCNLAPECSIRRLP
jgi:lipopolysaccharide transport system ATP-binding protein